MMKFKKFILFLVEGLNDEKELGAILKAPCFRKYHEDYVFRFIRYGTDITTERETSVNNILERIAKKIHAYRKNSNEGMYNGIAIQDIQEIVHIVDMDGAFIPREGISQGDTGRVYYSDNEIIAYNDDEIWGRNKKKSNVLRKLITTSKIAGVNYSLYYASCNMDHLLFDVRNPNEEQKRTNANAFRYKMERHPELMNESLFKTGIKAVGTYEDSWATIQEGTNSLQRKTNINLFFGENARHKK